MVELKIKLSFLKPDQEVKFKVPANNGMLHHHIYTGDNEHHSKEKGFIASGCTGAMANYFIYFKDQDITLSQSAKGEPIMVDQLLCQTNHVIELRYTNLILVSHKDRSFFDQIVKHMESLHEKV